MKGTVHGQNYSAKVWMLRWWKKNLHRYGKHNLSSIESKILIISTECFKNLIMWWLVSRKFCFHCFPFPLWSCPGSILAMMFLDWLRVLNLEDRKDSCVQEMTWTKKHVISKWMYKTGYIDGNEPASINSFLGTPVDKTSFTGLQMSLKSLLQLNMNYSDFHVTW